MVDWGIIKKNYQNRVTVFVVSILMEWKDTKNQKIYIKNK